LFYWPIVAERVGRRLIKAAAAHCQICSQKKSTLLGSTHVEDCVIDARTGISGERHVCLVGDNAQVVDQEFNSGVVESGGPRRGVDQPCKNVAAEFNVLNLE
jgi:hypothetical protein